MRERGSIEEPEAEAQCTMDTPIGALVLVASARAVRHIRFHGARVPGVPEAGAHPVLDRARAQLGEYFSGERRRFDLPLDPAGTDFQRQVWRALEQIPFGERRSYQDVATSIGRPRAVRAVGAANGDNPIPIVIPCHRVIGKDGSMTGFGGGLDTKRWLLAHEHQHAPWRLEASR